MTEVVFYIFAAAAVLSATLCILQKSPMASALWLVSTMFSLAAIYVLLNAQFIVAIQLLALIHYSPRRLANELSQWPTYTDPATAFVAGQLTQQEGAAHGVVM